MQQTKAIIWECKAQVTLSLAWPGMIPFPSFLFCYWVELGDKNDVLTVSSGSLLSCCILQNVAWVKLGSKSLLRVLANFVTYPFIRIL